MALIHHILYPNFKISNQKLSDILNNKTILITGASHGIGNLLAQKLVFPNTHLILMGRTEEKLNEICIHINNNGGNAQYLSGDLRDKNTINKLFKLIEDQKIEIDIFINNAGNSIRRSIYHSLNRFHDFTRTMNLNYYAPVEITLHIIPTICKNKGQIINISSFIVLLPSLPFWSAYQASKSAFHIWLNSIKPELNLNGVYCNNIYLPLVRTRMISPTKKFKDLPVMEPQQATDIICKAITQKKYDYKPWWIKLLKISFLLFGKKYNKKTAQKASNAD